MADRFSKHVPERSTNPKSNTKQKSPTVSNLNEHKTNKKSPKSKSTHGATRKTTTSKASRRSLPAPASRSNASQPPNALGLPKCYILLERIDPSNYGIQNEAQPLVQRVQTPRKRATATKKNHKKTPPARTINTSDDVFRNAQEYNPPQRRSSLPIITRIHNNIGPMIRPDEPSTSTGITRAYQSHAELITQADTVTIKVEPEDEDEVEVLYDDCNDAVKYDNYDNESTLADENSEPDTFTQITSEFEIDGYGIVDYNRDAFDVADENDPLDISEPDDAPISVADIELATTEPSVAVHEGAAPVLENETNNQNADDAIAQPPDVEDERNMIDGQPISTDQVNPQISACDELVNIDVVEAMPNTDNSEGPQPTNQTQEENHVDEVHTSGATKNLQMNDLEAIAGPSQPHVSELVNKSPETHDSSQRITQSCELSSENGVIPQFNAEEYRISHENVPNLDFEAMLSAESFDHFYKPDERPNEMRSSAFAVSVSSLVPYSDDDAEEQVDGRCSGNSLSFLNGTDPLHSIEGSQTSSTSVAEFESNPQQSAQIIPEQLIQLCESVANNLDRIRDNSNDTNGAEFK